MSGIAGAHHIFIFIQRRPVDELNPRQFVDVHRTLRKLAQPLEIFGTELIPSPERGESSDRVEVLKIHETANRFVVIAPHEHMSQRLRFRNDFVGIAAVADSIAKIDDKVIGRSGGQTRIQRLQVAMYVAQKKNAHKGRIIASLGSKARARI